jgi:hypothetical protein
MRVLMVGMALDTNGQKRRFVEAAKRWGDDPDVLKALVVGEHDLAGVAGRWVTAGEKEPALSIRSAHKARYAYFQYPEDLVWDRSTEPLVRQLADAADLIHLTNELTAYTRLGQHRHRKPALLHHHGTLLRNFPQRVLPQARRFHMLNAVSTVDLLRVADDLHWLPTAYDLDELATIREQNRRPADGMVRIMSAPTNRDIKSTALLEAAMNQLKAEGLPVELVLTEGRTWAECLAVKATADIYFDQVKLGYGCNAIEAWGMGLPVVAGAEPDILARMTTEWNTDRLPFAEATEATIADTLRMLVKSPDLRAEYAERGHTFAETYHAEKPALERLTELYDLAIRKMKAAPSAVVEEFPLAPGTFATTLPKLSIRVSNQHYKFVDQRLTVDNPRMAQRVRQLARHQPGYQISEVTL